MRSRARWPSWSATSATARRRTWSAQPNPRLCVLCHERGYDDLQATWQGEIEERVARLQASLDAGGSAGVDPAALERARGALRAVTADGSRGVHNYELAKKLLEDALRDVTTD